MLVILQNSIIISETINGRFKICCRVDSGNEMGLSLILNADIHDYYCSSTRSYGFKVLLHNPNDLPRVAYYGVAIPVGYESRLVIEPVLAEASDAILRVPKRIRNCIFENENFLKFYR